MPDLPIPDRLPHRILGLLAFGPRLAAAGLRLTGATLRGVAELLDHSPAGAAPASDEDRLWTAPEPAPGHNGSGDLDSAAAPQADAPGTSPEPPGAAPRPARQRPPATAASEASEPPHQEVPEHVSEEPTLVAEVADPGAEEGAGAELHVDEPWPGFAEMPAPAIVDRLAAEPLEVIAVIDLYERSHRRRRTVLEAAERELRRRSGPGERG